MKVRIAVLAMVVAVTLGAAHDAVDRCSKAGRLLDEIMATPEKAIPSGLLDKAHCVALIPGVKKAAFVFGGRFGKGVIQCRQGEGWTGPSMVRLEGVSFGLQIGASSTDIVLLVLNELGRDKLLSSNFTLGADAAVAAGPVGRSAQAQTDAQMRAKILSYSLSRGVFAGASLEGATLRPDHDSNEEIYGEPVDPKEILAGKIPAPEKTCHLAGTLAKYSSGALPAEVVEAPAQEPERAQESGLLTLTSEPQFAEVEINQVFNGMTPRKKVLDAGGYELRLSKAGFETWTKTLVVSPGERVELHAELVPVQIKPRKPAAPVDESRQAKKAAPASNSRLTIIGLP